jgi:hypothetical protein
VPGRRTEARHLDRISPTLNGRKPNQWGAGLNRSVAVLVEMHADLVCRLALLFHEPEHLVAPGVHDVGVVPAELLAAATALAGCGLPLELGLEVVLDPGELVRRPYGPVS